MLFTGLGEAWGQASIDDTVEPDNTITEILYVAPGQSTTITMQDNNDATGMYGYIRWYVEDQSGNRTAPVEIFPNSNTQTNRFTRYSNGLATTRDQNTGYAGSITCQFSESQINSLTLVYEASSVKPLMSGNNISKPRVIGIRHKFELRNAKERADALEKKQVEFKKLSISGNDLKALREASDPSLYVLNAYDIYIPVGSTSNFRLPEELRNYYIPNNNVTQATQVRWTINRYNGRSWSNSQNTVRNSNLTDYSFNDDIKKAYILAEVSSDNSTWYPVSFLNVTMVDGSGPMTAGELNRLSDSDKKVYKHRFEDKLDENTALYRRLARISFEDADDILTYPSSNGLTNYLESNLTDNFKGSVFTTENGDKVDSYYAFAHPEMHANRGNELKVMKGEYGLYRTLNYPDISAAENSSNSTVWIGNSTYSDYFPTQYDRSLTDRLWEKTEGTQSGYFMYIDASEIPGVITKIPISGLCPNTSLIVNAWICEVTNDNRTKANVGFTLKGKKGEGTQQEEVILAKYYSGALHTKPSGDGTGNAEWQQVSFKFSFSDTDIKDTDEFILEISSNCESSSGADFGIDDISIYCTRPAITAQREDACESSVLMVSTDYETLRSNMMWDIESDVIDKNELSNAKYRKYRYGLMGDDPYAAVEDVLHSNVGNVYFAFTNINTDKTVGDWISVNKDLAKHEEDLPDVPENLQYAMRVAVQTDMNVVDEDEIMIPKTADEALRSEIIMNVRAMHDFLEDIKRGNVQEDDDHMAHVADLEKLIIDLRAPKTSTGSDVNPTDTNPLMIDSVEVHKILTTPSLYKEYERAVRDLFICLEIPRIRCPWRSEDGTMLYLSKIDVHNTDLHFVNEVYKDEQGKEHTASGEYYVILFSARQIAEGSNLDLDSECALKKNIYVVPSVTITVQTAMDPEVIACEGSIRSLNANLEVAKVDDYGNVTSTEMEPFDTAYPQGAYTFDWYLGTEEEYNKLSDLQGIIKKLRDDLGSNNDEKIKRFTTADVESCGALSPDEKTLLIGLLGTNPNDTKLVSGITDVEFRWVDKVLVIPYIADIKDMNDEGEEILKRRFCAKPQWLELTEGANSPGLDVGFPDVNYADVQLNPVPLRLGLGNLKDQATITIPIRKNIELGIEDTEGGKHVLKNLTSADGKTVSLWPSGGGSVGIPVGEVGELYAEENGDNNHVKLRFTLTSEQVDNYFKEGESYSLYLHFGEYKEVNGTATLIPNSCDGTAYLTVKIVPEYITWKGTNTNNASSWYDDAGNWTISTKEELHDSDDGSLTENAVSTTTFSPLYFTKVTVADVGERGNVLSLENEPERSEGDNQPLSDGITANPIKYDMAVDMDGNDLKVVPYYGNKVEKIYFKPDAKLVNQQYLSYDAAWVEFKIANNEKRWMASPLEDVYAGDIYAPSNNGKQETVAFENITYDNTTPGTYSRWQPAFYQKAWNKAIDYATTTDGTSSQNVAAVKSNWSIEYNNVAEAYSIGKGFYLSVEEVPTGDAATRKDGTAIVRLPKADQAYTYEAAPTTKANTEFSAQTRSAGHMAAYQSQTGEVTLKLGDVYGETAADVAGVEAKKRHFLIGNPYMTYLNVGTFLSENTNLEPKYWTLENNVSNATVVGTPDVPFDNEYTTGTVEPMQAFFVELKDGETDLDVTFTPAMMSAIKVAASGVTTKSTSATNPALTLTADRGDVKSVATLRTSDKADNAYEADEDAVVLLDSELDVPMVYTVAGSQAAQVNAVKSVKNIGLGVFNEGGGEVTITIEGLSRMAETLYLYDAQTRKSVKLDSDSYSLTLSGDSHGRYYLRDSALGSELENTISIYSAQRGRVIVSALRPVKDIKVFGLNGSLARQFSVNTTQYSFDLPAGIYMIYASDGEQEYTEKVIVR